MTSTGRRLLLHAGVGKTGSSALQTAFVQNRDLLAASGILYPTHASDERARQGGVTSGNGARLRPWLTPDPARPGRNVARVRARLRDELTSPATHTVLYSSEFLYLAARDRLEQLQDQVTGQGAALHVVVYVRDIVGHALSSYSQVVKRSLFTGSFGDYVAPGTAGGYHLPLDRLLALPELLGESAVTLVHYDSVGHDLVRDFCRQVLGLDPAAVQALRVAPPVNRSLTPLELDVMRRLNSGLADKARARRVSDLLLGMPAAGRLGHPVSDADLRVLRERFSAPVDAINQRFFDAPRLAVGQVPGPVGGPGHADESDLREQVLLRLVARLAES